MTALKKSGIFIAMTVVAVFGVVLFWDAVGFRSPIFAFVVNLLAFCWAGVVVNPTVHLYFPERYYAIKGFERTGRLYERLGVRLFKRLVMLVYRGLPGFSESRTASTLRRLEENTREGEASHMFVFVLMLPFVGYAALRGWPDAVAWLMAFNVVLHLYPVMLHRYNRGRLRRLLRKMAARREQHPRESSVKASRLDRGRV